MRPQPWRGRGRVPFDVLLALGVLAMGAGAPLLGQQLPPSARRAGFWASGGAGYVTLKAGCATCEDNTYRPGLALYVRAGGTPTPAVRVGGELASLRRESETSSSRLFFAMVIGQWYPAPASGLYVQVGYGIANGRQDYAAGDTTIRTSSTGLGLVLGLGWELPIGRIALMPFAAMYTGALGDIEVHDATGAALLLKDAIGTGYQLGISIGSP